MVVNKLKRNFDVSAVFPLIENCLKFVKYENKSKCVIIGINTDYDFEKPVFSLAKSGFVLKKEKSFGNVSVIIPEGRVFCESTVNA